MAVVDATGVRGESLSEHRTDLERRFRDSFGAQLDLAPETPQGQIIGILAAAFTEFDEAVVAQGNAMAADHAEKAQLTDLGSLLGIDRGAATRSRVTAVLTGVAGASVPAGSRAQTADNAQFETLAKTILSTSGTTAEMQAVDPGPVEAAANALNSIVTVVPGWETVNNPAAAVVGQAEESDASYRRRLLARTARPASGPRDAFRAAVLEAGASKVRVEYNDSSAVRTVGLYTMQPYSVLVVVLGGTDTAISEAILRAKGMGVSPQTAIVGASPSALTVLQAITAGAFMWRGESFSALNLSSQTSFASCALALQTAIRTSTSALTDQTGINYVWPSAGQFVASYPWRTGTAPLFDTGSTITAFGLAGGMTGVAAQPGPFIRAAERTLTVSATVGIVRGIFPSDGQQRMRRALLDRAARFSIGELPRANDLLAILEMTPGAQVTAITVNDKPGSTAVSGVTMPIYGLYTLAEADISFTITEATGATPA